MMLHDLADMYQLYMLPAPHTHQHTYTAAETRKGKMNAKRLLAPHPGRRTVSLARESVQTTQWEQCSRQQQQRLCNNGVELKMDCCLAAAGLLALVVNSHVSDGAWLTCRSTIKVLSQCTVTANCSVDNNQTVAAAQQPQNRRRCCCNRYLTATDAIGGWPPTHLYRVGGEG